MRTLSDDQGSAAAARRFADRIGGGNHGEDRAGSMTDMNSFGTVSGDAPAVTQGTADLAPRRPGLLDAVRERAQDHLALVVGAVAVALVVAGQLVEDLQDAAPLQLLPPEISTARWTVIAVAVYLIVSVEIVRREAGSQLAALQRVVRIDDAKFEGYRRRMSDFHWTRELGLVLAAALVATLLFPILNWPLPTANDPVTKQEQYLPPSLLAAGVIVLGYTALGWAGLRLVGTTIRVARALSQLTRESVVVDVFDTTNLLPFGRIALAAALAPAGLIVLFLLGLGQPRSLVGWTVLLLATSASVLALVLPLRGIHRQMRNAKDEALTGLNRQLSEVHASLGDRPAAGASTGELNDRTGLLVSLRTVVGQMPTWPFRDTVAFGRAVLIASAPVIYAALNGLIDALFIDNI